MVSSSSSPSSRRPHSQKPKVRTGIHAAARRRRARSAAAAHRARQAASHAGQRGAPKHEPSEVNLGMPSSSADTDTTIPVTLPRYLSRPPFRKIANQIISSVAPELGNAELDYVREGLRSLGPIMLKVLSGIKVEVELLSNVLPKEISVVANDIETDLPTHMLGVYSRNLPFTAKRRVTLFPIHSVILAAHCANLPLLPASDVVQPDTAGSTVSLPVVPLCLPAPDVFPHLSTFLYTKRIDHLLASLLPAPAPHALYRDDPTSEHVLELLDDFSSLLADNYSAQTLLASAMSVNGLWRNACALGIEDKKLWCALDVAWEVLISALSISTDMPE